MPSNPLGKFLFRIPVTEPGAANYRAHQQALSSSDPKSTKPKTHHPPPRTGASDTGQEHTDSDTHFSARHHCVKLFFLHYIFLTMESLCLNYKSSVQILQLKSYVILETIILFKKSLN